MSLPPTERLTPEQEAKEHEYVYLEQLGMGATPKQAKVAADKHIMALRKQWRKEQSNEQ